MTTTTLDTTKVSAGALKPGDTIRSGGKDRTISAIEELPTTRRLTFTDGGATARPKRDTKVARVNSRTPDITRERIGSNGATPEVSRAPGLRDGSTMSAILEVLRAEGKPLSASEVYERVLARKLAPGLKGKTPVQTVAARLAVAAKKGAHGVRKTKPGRYTVKTEG